MTSFAGLARLAKPHLFSLIGSMILLGLHALTTGAYAYLVGPLLKFIYTGGESAGSRMTQTLDFLGWNPGGDPTELTAFIATTVVVLVIIKGLAYFSGTYIVALAGQRMEHTLRTTLYGHLVRISYERLSEIPRGDMISRFVNDVAAMKYAVTHGLTSIIRDALQVVVLAALAVSLDPVLGIITLGVLPISSTIIVRIGQRLRKRRHKAYDAYGDLASAVEQTTAALPVLRAFSAENHAENNFNTLSKTILRRNLRAWALQIFSSPLMELLGALALAATLWYAGHRISSGVLEPEEFVSFFAAVFLLYRPVKSLGDASSHLHSGLAALDRINVILDLPVEPPEEPDAIHISEIKDGITFDNVTFSYENDDPVLDEASFTIGAGQTVALVGSSGSGKTTIAMLLLRLLEPDKGTITIDDRDLQTIKRTSVRNLFALVTQDPVLLHDSIRANVTFGLDVPEKDLETALKAAGAQKFIDGLPEQFETSVGEAGTKLSGGEKQRLCIARALIRNSPALILDEATASVDSATEAEITSSLEKLMENRTTMMISHRLSTVRHADQIVVLDKGKVVAQGKYDKIVRQSESFRTIFAEQLEPSE